jgi:hypothetical protein
MHHHLCHTTRFAMCVLLFAIVARAEGPPEKASWSYDGELARCTEQQILDIMEADSFRAYLKDDADITDLDPLEQSKYLFARSLLPYQTPYKIYRDALERSDPFTAAALHNSLYSYLSGSTSLPGYFRDFTERYGPGTAPDLEAAFFAYIYDEPSYEDYYGMDEVLPVFGRQTRILNMYAKLADWLAKRCQPYMYYEWKRLSKFENNDRIKAIAEKALANLSPAPEAMQFSHLVQDIQAMHYPKASVRFGVWVRRSELLPPPYEHLRLRIPGKGTGPQVPVTLTNTEEEDKELFSDTLTAGDSIPLPDCETGEYILFLGRVRRTPPPRSYVEWLMPVPDTALFVILPAYMDRPTIQSLWYPIDKDE